MPRSPSPASSEKNSQSAAVRFDAADRTADRSAPRAHIIAIPRALLRADFRAAAEFPFAAAALRDGCAIVRLPHTRHGEAALFLCPPAANTHEHANINESANMNEHANIDESAKNDESVNFDGSLPVLYELQAQRPPGGFAQTWFINNTVEPNENLLTVTPLDVTFFALRQAFMHPMRDKFVSADDLFFGESPPCANFSSSSNASPNFSSSSSASPNFSSAQWPGWRAALAQCGGLAPALAAMRSDCVLSRVCETRRVGGDAFYRFSEERAAAWLREKMQRVAKCGALRALLRIDEGEKEKEKEKGNEKEKEKAVPNAVAFGVVAEYVVEGWVQAAARLCGEGSDG